MFEINELLVATAGKLVYGFPDAKAKGVSIDSRTIKAGEVFIAIKGDNFDGHDFIDEALRKGACCIIAGPSCFRGRENRRRVSLIKVKDTVKALGDIARFKRKKINLPVIAVTGSAGKTTVKEMIAHVLSGKFNVLKNIGTKNNFIGLPLTLMGLNDSHDMAVLELGTNHFGEIKYLAEICKPNIGIVTNIGPAHLEYFKSLEGVLKEKYALIEELEIPGIAILNADDGILRKKLNRYSRRAAVFSFGIKNRGDFWASEIQYRPNSLEFRVNQKYKFKLKSLGSGNVYNAQIAIAVARVFGMEYKDIARRLSGFCFPQSRLSDIILNSVRFIDDTYNSNPLSLDQALNALDKLSVRGRKIFVMGDMLELGNLEESFHLQAGKKAAKICDIFVSVGRLSGLSAGAAKSSGLSAKNVFICESCEQAREVLFNTISPGKGDIVLIKGSRQMRMEQIFKNKG